MTETMTRWLVPAVGLVLGLLIAASLLGPDASPAQAAIAFVIVAGYAIVLVALQSRSDVASLLSGMPRDERWDTINLRALSLCGRCRSRRRCSPLRWSRRSSSRSSGTATLCRMR